MELDLRLSNLTFPRMISSSMITSFGLSWWQSWICVWLGYAIAAMFVVITARIGATYHIGFVAPWKTRFMDLTPSGFLSLLERPLEYGVHCGQCLTEP
jgi:Permease for cytosine/purines, uracil, thiamine, allantoin